MVIVGLGLQRDWQVMLMSNLINVYVYQDEYYPYVFFDAYDEEALCNIKMTKEQYEYHRRKKAEFELWQDELRVLGMTGGDIDG